MAPAALLATLVLAGCSSASQDAGAVAEKPAGGKPSQKAGAAGKTAAEGGTVGGSGSACPLPVTFDLAASWKPKAVSVDPDSELGAALGVQGRLTMVCEIDAKPAGNIGYLRVWQGEKSGRTPRQVLEAFIADEDGAGKITYTGTGAGDMPATEADYTVSSELLDEPKKERAFAVSTPDGPVVVHLGGLDSREHEAMLPAYELAKKSVRLG
ncbi:lipoprotein [Streptomyces sp. NPDC057908]|uniref:lipoprotein n=1 Tax=unclassified Streptomyces TaxID=2593676 RepID=UPI002E0F55B4|nr:lipoprotein [Streptomyces sp. NBC_01224]